MPTTINPSDQTITQYTVQVGGASNTLASVGPGTSGQILQSAGNASNPAYSTSTYPTTNAVNTLLYASSANVMAALATANSGVLTTSSSGVPSIDTTNFSVLTTGVQMKGNNTNTAPPSGFIGEQIRSSVLVGSAVVLSNGTVANVTSISLTAGIWDVSLVAAFTGSGTATNLLANISSTSASIVGNQGDNVVQTSISGNANTDSYLTIPSYRVTLSSTTSIYLVVRALFASGAVTAYGTIRATRVG